MIAKRDDMAFEDTSERKWWPVADTDPIVRQKTKVSKPSREMLLLAEDLSLFMRKGWQRRTFVGIAANQLGVDESVCVVENPMDKRHLTMMMNPKIRLYRGTVIDGPEGCLTLPAGDLWAVSRHEVVVVDYQDCLTGENKIFAPYGLHSRIAQHEIDHLNGILISDKGRKIRTNGEVVVHVRKEVHGFSSICGGKDGFTYGFTPGEVNWMGYKRCEACAREFDEMRKALVESMGP